MSLQYLLDTHIVSHYLRRTSPGLEQKLNQALASQLVAISVVTTAELLYAQAGLSAQDKRRNLIALFLTRLPNLQWTQAAAVNYAGIKAIHRKMGTGIGGFDAQIAAHAVAESLTLVTHKPAVFGLIAHLKVEDWTI